jgi:colanic acid/amylovoran biosynthesis glycosyltransferase
MAYVLLWFPKPSETFIFREVVNLWRMGLPLKVFTLYGYLKKWLTSEMLQVAPQVERMGPWAVNDMWAALRYWKRRDPATVDGLMRTIPLRRWRSLEVAGENLWAFFAGFHLARRFEQEGIEFIHAPWANGPATAAWVASKLTGIPFSFSARAVDIYPPDGALEEKIRDSVLVRTNTLTNVGYLKNFAKGDSEKIHLVYNGHPLLSYRPAQALMKPPYRILAMGRFARFKGYDVLLKAAKILDETGIDFRLTLAGSGIRSLYLKSLARSLGLRRKVIFPGYVPHDRVSELYSSSDIFVMPSIVHRTGERDGIPNVIVEALLHRLPVVATPVSGIGEIIEHGVTGFMADPGDHESLAHTIQEVLRDRPLSISVAQRGHERALEQFDPETNFSRLLELFKDTFNGLSDRR